MLSSRNLDVPVDHLLEWWDMGVFKDAGHDTVEQHRLVLYVQGQPQAMLPFGCIYLIKKGKGRYPWIAVGVGVSDIKVC